jgi:hypothetical protein
MKKPNLIMLSFITGIFLATQAAWSCPKDKNPTKAETKTQSTQQAIQTNKTTEPKIQPEQKLRERGGKDLLGN